MRPFHYQRQSQKRPRSHTKPTCPFFCQDQAVSSGCCRDSRYTEDGGEKEKQSEPYQSGMQNPPSWQAVPDVRCAHRQNFPTLRPVVCRYKVLIPDYEIYSFGNLGNDMIYSSVVGNTFFSL